MAETGSNLSAGPMLSEGEKAVHIIFVPVELAIGGVHGGRVTAIGLQQVAQHIGTPALTDVVVCAGKPFHFAEGELKEHPQVHKDHPETILQLHRLKKEKAVWWSEHPFEITRILAAQHHAPPASGGSSAPDADGPYPFSDKPVTRLEGAIHVARSTVPIEGADNHDYKISFTIGGDPIDPDMHCSP